LEPNVAPKLNGRRLHMRTRHSSSRTRLASGRRALVIAFGGLLFALTITAVGAPDPAHAASNFEVLCNTGGDQFGYSIATNGDYNGDGISDIAVGAPCYHSGIHPRAGRVMVYSGANGKRLLARKGFQTGMWMGTSVSFIPDINGDGRDELAVGSPGYTVTQIDDISAPPAGLVKGGRVDVFQKRHRRLKLFGLSAQSGFGEQVAPVGDIDLDRRGDIAVAASRGKKLVGRDRPGRIYFFSGRRGDLINVIEGPKNGKRFGKVLETAGDVTGDGVDDLLVGTDEMTLLGVTRQGLVDTLDAMAPADELFRVVGAKGDRIGRSVAAAGDVDDDGIPDFITGSDGSDDTGVKKAGLVTLFSSDGRRIWTAFDPELQEGENFGSAVASLGDINHDDVGDYVASAIDYNQVFRDRGRDDVGRIISLSGVNGDAIWAVNGEFAGQKFGFQLEPLPDTDNDHTLDLAVGSIGDHPFGRRGAGSVELRSGATGELLREFAGKRGLETRIVVGAPIPPRVSRVRSFNHRGGKRELSAQTHAGVSFGDMSVSIVNDRQTRPRPGVVQVVVATGAGSTSSQVEVYTMGRKRRQIDKFQALPNLTDTGANCAAGELDGEVNEDLVCAQADSPDGNVIVRVLKRTDEEDLFFPIDEFQVWNSEDIFSEFFPINAGGATIACGDVLGGSADEIIVGTTTGVPFVKVFSASGQLLSSFLAYDPVGFSGVDVAVADLDGGGEMEIVTAPRSGQALIKVFKGNGVRATVSGNDPRPISILASTEFFEGGARVAGADVDLDDVQEIIVMHQQASGARVVQAFERDGSEVPTDVMRAFDPFPESTISGGDIEATDHYVRE
jgi:hypothetical protein